MLQHRAHSRIETQARNLGEWRKRGVCTMLLAVTCAVQRIIIERAEPVQLSMSGSNSGCKGAWFILTCIQSRQ
jgi:hypothetical protein